MSSFVEILSPAMERELVSRFGGPGVPLALLGSYARGEAGPFSDIDVVRFADGEGFRSTDASYFVRGKLAVVSTASPDDVESWFERPESIVDHVGGMRQAQVLADEDGVVADVRERALAFRWTPELSRRADAWVADQMVGWIEEVFKGLEGLRRDDVGRLLNARFGLSWGLSRVMVVHRRLLLEGDNAMHAALERSLGGSSSWIALRDRAFGVTGTEDAETLRGHVRAGIELYRETAALVADRLAPDRRDLVEATLAAIAEELGAYRRPG
ncbi:MAG: nucleotidyltransferase domain-containing protein [Deinococcales bacterium]